ncbi:MAG: TonB-dependent receptor [Prolixibacteraceae bacterium]|nr:TonB-dependent receptor [Prolixibacteraceae bacterium]
MKKKWMFNKDRHPYALSCLIRVMKLTTFFLLITFITVNASVYSQVTKLDLKVQNVTVKEVLSRIEDQSQFFFMYNDRKIDVERKIDLDLKQAKIEDLLKTIFGGTNTKFIIKDRQIVLYNESDQEFQVSNIEAVMQQQKTVSGKVTDSTGGSLPGVSVAVKGTTNGAITDVNGKYSLTNLPANAILQFSFVGMKTQEIAVAGKTTINVTLAEEAIGIEEVVAVGYGTKVKGAVTGAIEKVDSKTFEMKPIINTMDALQGTLPGVTVTRSGGRPGNEGYSLQIRGYSSINGNKPLVLVDGVPGDIDVLNPNDIADVTVLKDAAASIYGARAADGVLLITTKKGSKGKPTVSYSYNYGIKTPQFLKKMTNTMQLAEMYDEGMRNIGQPGLDQSIFDKIRANAEPDPSSGWMKYLENFPGFYQSTDWNKVVYGTGIQQMHNLSISGGGDNNAYLISAGYESNEGVFNFGENKSDRYNLRLNYDFNILNRLNIETRSTFDNTVTIEPSFLDEALRVLSRSWSYLPVYNPLGQFYKYQGYGNPASDLEEGGTATADYSRFSTNLKVDFKILEGFKFVSQSGIELGYWNGNANYRKFQAYNWTGGNQGVYNDPNSAYYANSKSLYKTFTNYLDYNKTFLSKHHIGLMLGTSFETYNKEYQSTTGYNFTSNELFTLNLSDKTKLDYTKNFTGSASGNALNSYFGRFSYSYSNKLFVDITMRMDGSSKFASEKRWSAVFPALSASWNLLEEEFVKSLNIFDRLKLRSSWGQSGNQDLSFGNYDYIPLVNFYGSYPIGSPNVGLSGAESSIASSSRSWETIETTNVGLDFTVLNSRLSSSFDYFIKKNKDMLVGVQVPATLGGNPPTSNAGTLESKGWEYSVKWSDKKGDFRYSVSASISDSKNNLINLEGNDAYYEGLNYARQGYSLYSYFGYQFDGIIQNEEQLTNYKKLQGIPANIGIGDVMYRDIDGDGKITSYGDPAKGTKGDMQYLGNKLPRYTYSSSINLSYKNFDFNITLQGVGKRDEIKGGDFSQPYFWVWHQPLEYFYGKNWTPENTGAKYPRIVPGGVGFDELKNWNWRTSTMRIDNMAYMRVKQITVAYNLPQEFCKRIKMQGVRVYASGKDLFTICKGTWNKSYDPEDTRSDEQTYPLSNVISFGADIKF